MSHLVSKTAIDEVGVQDMAPNEVDKYEEKKRERARKAAEEDELVREDKFNGRFFTIF